MRVSRNRLGRLAQRADLHWGLSGLSARFEDDEQSPRFYFEGGDFSITWHPFREASKRLRWQSEFIAAQIEDGSSWERSYGMYSFIDYQFAPDWTIGARYDYAECSREHITEYAAYLTHQYTSNNRLRVQFKNTRRIYDKETNELFLQWIFTLGHHSHLDDDAH